MMPVLIGCVNGVQQLAAKKKARELLERMGLSQRLGHFPSELSGGEKQRVALARALIVYPDILLLDEPFSALDDQLRLEMRRCLTDVVKSELRVPAILVTHNVLEAYTLADRVLIYSGGRVIQSGTPQVVFANPVNEEVMSLVNLIKLYPAHLFA
jgi:ABC-type sulfate/molybdate transport systems ATPase subunit